MHCLICGAACSGHHYKVPSCRACAGFYRRTVQMKLRYRCRNNGNCTITRESRFSCRFCRMKKCIDVGMTITDEAIVAPEFHLDTSENVLTRTKPKIPVSPFSNDSLPNMDEWDSFTFETIINDNEKFVQLLKGRVTEILNTPYTPPGLPYKLNICQQSALAWDNHERKWPPIKPEDLKEINFSVAKSFIVDHCKEMIIFAEFLMDIDQVATLPYSQKAILFRNWGMTFFHINRVAATIRLLGTDPGCSKMVMFDGGIFDYFNPKFDISWFCNMDAEQFQKLNLDSDIMFDNLLIKQWKKVLPDEFEIQYLLMRSLWSLHGQKGIAKETLSKADQILSQLDDELGYYYKYEKKVANFASRIYKLHNVLSALERVSETRLQDQKMWKTFDIFKLDICMNDLTS